MTEVNATMANIGNGINWSLSFMSNSVASNVMAFIASMQRLACISDIGNINGSCAENETAQNFRDRLVFNRWVCKLVGLDATSLTNNSVKRATVLFNKGLPVARDYLNAGSKLSCAETMGLHLLLHSYDERFFMIPSIAPFTSYDYLVDIAGVSNSGVSRSIHAETTKYKVFKIASNYSDRKKSLIGIYPVRMYLYENSTNFGDLDYRISKIQLIN